MKTDGQLPATAPKRLRLLLSIVCGAVVLPVWIKFALWLVLGDEQFLASVKFNPFALTVATSLGAFLGYRWGSSR